MTRSNKTDEKEVYGILLQRCIRLISLRPRTEKEISVYLRRQEKKIGGNDELFKGINKELKEKGLIDDGQFIKWWVEQRSYFKPKSMFVLKSELIQKGIKRNLVDKYFSKHMLDEQALASRLLQKKRNSLERLGKREQFKKAVNFLTRRGFSYGIAKKALEDFVKKE